MKKPKNAWVLGYNAAMRAAPEELTEAGESAALATAMKKYILGEFASSQFRAGWRSVLRCERRDEVPK